MADILITGGGIAASEDTDDKETIKSITYGQKLTGKYLENYNNMMAQSQAIIESLVGKDGKLK